VSCRVSQSFSALEVEVLIATLEDGLRRGVDGTRSADLERLLCKALDMRKVARARHREQARVMREREAKAS
jgi:hypothetical protein